MGRIKAGPGSTGGRLIQRFCSVAAAALRKSSHVLACTVSKIKLAGHVRQHPGRSVMQEQKEISHN